jgi:predicted nucleic acid-binding Zn ribbon protein
MKKPTTVAPKVRLARRGGLAPSTKPVCRICGKAVLYGNLTCSLVCDTMRTERQQENAAALEQAGFVRDLNTPNVFSKDGIAMTLEVIEGVGLERAIRNHAIAAEARNVP